MRTAIKQYHPNDRAAVRDAIETCRKPANEELEVRRQTADEPSAGSDSGPKRRFAFARRNASIVRDITRKEREPRLMVRVGFSGTTSKQADRIRGNSRLLQEELGSPDRSVDAAETIIDRIENASKELDSLAERARTFDRAIERDLRNGTLHLEQTLVDIRDDLTEQHSGATIEVAPTDAEVSGRQDGIDPVLEIPVENALEYSDLPNPTSSAETPAGQVTVASIPMGPFPARTASWTRRPE
ncbi:hypothetical protein C8039_07985 [Halogeometricum sp. wsp3]|nr:hypothetical protein C8039_07985 [Halogeometricum sp. wsp3]